MRSIHALLQAEAPARRRALVRQWAPDLVLSEEEALALARRHGLLS